MVSSQTTVTFKPKGLLLTAAFVGVMSVLLTTARQVELGLAVGGLSVLAYVVVEVLFSVNPAFDRDRRRN